jgi:hypothetical protein
MINCGGEFGSSGVREFGSSGVREFRVHREIREIGENKLGEERTIPFLAP